TDRVYKLETVVQGDRGQFTKCGGSATGAEGQPSHAVRFDTLRAALVPDHGVAGRCRLQSRGLGERGTERRPVHPQHRLALTVEKIVGGRKGGRRGQRGRADLPQRRVERGGEIGGTVSIVDGGGVGGGAAQA